MQLSLLSEMPELEKKVFLDIFAKVYYDTRRNRHRLKTIDGQLIPSELKVGCPEKFVSEFPEGTIYKLDARLVQKNGKQPYFITLNRKKVMRAIEFFDHNLKVQKGTCSEQKIKKVSFEKKKNSTENVEKHIVQDIEIF
jgi:hypothetical protein